VNHMIRSVYYTNFQSCLRYGIISGGGDYESKNIQCKQKKKVILVISGVS
jgi:hypothetical protein